VKGDEGIAVASNFELIGIILGFLGNILDGVTTLSCAGEGREDSKERIGEQLEQRSRRETRAV